MKKMTNVLHGTKSNYFLVERLIRAVVQGYMGDVVALVDTGITVNPHNHRVTPLIKAVQLRRDEIVEYLLSVGADTQLQDEDGLRAIDYARDWWIADMLLEGV